MPVSLPFSLFRVSSIHSTKSHFSVNIKFQYYINLPPALSLVETFSGFPIKIIYTFLISPTCSTWLAEIIFLYLISNNIWRKYKLCSFHYTVQIQKITTFNVNTGLLVMPFPWTFLTHSAFSSTNRDVGGTKPKHYNFNFYRTPSNFRHELVSTPPKHWMKRKRLCKGPGPVL